MDEDKNLKKRRELKKRGKMEMVSAAFLFSHGSIYR